MAAFGSLQQVVFIGGLGVCAAWRKEQMTGPGLLEKGIINHFKNHTLVSREEEHSK